MKSLDSLLSMAGDCVLVTGAAGNIGLKVAETFAELEARLILIDRDLEALEGAKKKILSHWPSREVLCLECDLESEESRIKLADEVKAGNSGLNALVHCAGFVGTTELQGWAVQFEKQSLDTWRRAFEVNLTSAFHLSQLFSGELAEKNGSITFFSSIYGVLGPDYSIYGSTEMGNPAAYASSKGGLVQLSRWLATTMAPHVRVNCISPGGVARNQAPEFIEKYQNKTPLGRLAVEDDFKGVVALLATDAGCYITGQNIMVDGGWSAW